MSLTLQSGSSHCATKADMHPNAHRLSLYVEWV